MLSKKTFCNLESTLGWPPVVRVRSNFLTRLIHCITHTFCQLIISHKFNNNLHYEVYLTFFSALWESFFFLLCQPTSKGVCEERRTRKSFWLKVVCLVGTPAVPFMEQSCVSSDSFIDREFIGCHSSNCIARLHTVFSLCKSVRVTGKVDLQEWF